MKTKVLDHGYVEFVEAWGSDENIIRAARMSTDKGFQGWDLPCDKCGGSGAAIAEHLIEGGFPCKKCGGSGRYGDERLLKYLWEHKHHTPFEMAGMVIEVQAPIMVFRQWERHRTQSYNELSGRYTTLPDLYYVPSEARLIESVKKSSNKQATGSGELTEKPFVLQMHIEEAHSLAREKYNILRAAGVSDELARIVLPVSQYSKLRASANLRNWLHFLSLRVDSHAQWEIRQFAIAAGEMIEARFPRTYQLFDEGGKQA